MTTALAIDSQAAFVNRSYNEGSSEASKKLSELLKKFAQNLSSSVTLTRSDDLIDELFDIYDDCSSANWDGYGSRPLAKKALSEAERFILAMPIWMPTPEIVPEPNGDIGFQWSFGKDRILTASLNGHNLVTYAAILGIPERQKYGSEIFNDSIPEEIIDGLGKIRS